MHWWSIKQTYQETFINITTLLNPEGANMDLIFLGLRIAATVLPDTQKTQLPLQTATDLAQQTPP